MSLAFMRFGFLASVVGLIAGCGGGPTSGGARGGGGGTGGGGSNSTVAITFKGGTPLVAAKIGSGNFAMQTLNSGTLSLSIPSGTSNYAVAYLCPVIGASAQLAEEAVWEASTADGTSIDLYCTANSSTQGMGTLTGILDASAIPGVLSFNIGAANSNASLWQGTGGPTTDFSFPFPSGSDRVLVLAYNSEFQGPLAAKNFDNQSVPGALNGGNAVIFGAADETTPEAITYNNVPAGFSNTSTYVMFEMGAAAAFPIASEAAAQYPALPAGAMESGDIYTFEAQSYAAGNNPAGVFAGTTSSGGPVTFTFPAPWSYAGPAPAALPTFNFDYTGFAGKANVVQEGMFYWQTGSSGLSKNTTEIGISATANYQSGSTTLTVPDLSSLTGFLAAPASGTQVSWAANVLQYNYGFGGTIPLNSTWSGAGNSGTYTVP